MFQDPSPIPTSERRRQGRTHARNNGNRPHGVVAAATGLEEPQILHGVLYMNQGPLASLIKPPQLKLLSSGTDSTLVIAQTVPAQPTKLWANAPRCGKLRYARAIQDHVPNAQGHRQQARLTTGRYTEHAS